jgi:putative addiction module CopG family antidote
MVAPMNVALPPDLEAFARELVRAGAFASGEEAVAGALRDYQVRLERLRALIDEGDESGEPVDGETFLRELLAELESEAPAEV